MRTVSKNTVTAVCVAADVQDFDYVATILNAYVNLTPAPEVPEAADESYWWCDVCSQRVEGRQVTYHEYHDGCSGKVRVVTTHSPVLPVVTEAMVTAVARVICRKHADVCGVNEDDAWATYSPDFKDEAREYLHAASEVRG